MSERELIDISDLRKAAVLAALYNNSTPRGMGFIQASPDAMTEAEALELLAEATYFDYLRGRVMKLSLHCDEIDPWGYDRDNGEGLAGAVIDNLRATGSVLPVDRQESLTRLRDAAAAAVDLVVPGANLSDVRRLAKSEEPMTITGEVSRGVGRFLS